MSENIEVVSQEVAEKLKLSKPEQPDDHFDPTDSLDKETIDGLLEKVNTSIRDDNDMELNLAKSETRVPGQNWVLVSFVGECLSQKTSDLGMKVWGTFDDIADAKKHADKIGKDQDNAIFDVYILEMYTWAIIPPKKEFMEDQNYHEEKLHTIITERKRQQMLAKEVFETRKDKLKANTDVNEYNRNKKELNDLMKPEIKEIQNSEGFKQVFGDSDKLPELEVVDKDQKTRSVGQRLTESDEEYAKRRAELEKNIEEMRSADESILGETDYNEKFYNK